MRANTYAPESSSREWVPRATRPGHTCTSKCDSTARRSTRFRGCGHTASGSSGGRIVAFMATAERPGFTPGYGISTDSAGLLDWGWAEERLTRSRNYWVCTMREDGRPHAAPVWGIWLDDAVLFSS